LIKLQFTSRLALHHENAVRASLAVPAVLPSALA